MVVLIVFLLFAGCAPERMMATIVISDSDSEFERDVQEATRWSLMTVAPVGHPSILDILQFDWYAQITNFIPGHVQ